MGACGPSRAVGRRCAPYLSQAARPRLEGTTSPHPPTHLPTGPTAKTKTNHKQVQENCIDLVGRIADRGAEYVPAREWMRICFELLDMLKAHKKAIRRATVNTFGYIAKAIGPQVCLWVCGCLVCYVFFGGG